MWKRTVLKRWLIHVCIALFCISTLLLKAVPVVATEVTLALPELSEIYPNAPGSSELGAEFIELFNPSSASIDLAGYTIRVKDKAAKIMVLSGQLAPYAYKSFTTLFSLVNGGETIQLLRNDEVIHEVAYGSGAEEDQSWSYFYEGWELAEVTKDAPNKRIESGDPDISDVCPATAEIDTVLPPGYILNEDGTCVPVAQEVCLVDISEIAAQPLLAGREYIEFINNTEGTSNLQLCKVSINSSTERQLPPVLIEPGQRHVYEVSNGTIRNSAGMVTLTQSINQEFQYIYPATESHQAVNFDTDSLAGVVTDTPTPGAPNQSHQSSGEEGSTPLALEDCGPGRYRSPETNRCRTLEGGADLLSCASDQERNPDTNRCRKITASATLAACEPGQERNPETNRCRKTSENGETLKPCEPGQERNSQTNRCRKVASAVSGTPLEGIGSPAKVNTSKYKIPVVVSILLLAMGYVVYEYRSDIKNKYYQLRKRSHTSKVSG